MCICSFFNSIFPENDSNDLRESLHIHSQKCICNTNFVKSQIHTQKHDDEMRNLNQLKWAIKRTNFTMIISFCSWSINQITVLHQLIRVYLQHNSNFNLYSSFALFPTNWVTTHHERYLISRKQSTGKVPHSMSLDYAIAFQRYNERYYPSMLPNMWVLPLHNSIERCRPKTQYTNANRKIKNPANEWIVHSAMQVVASSICSAAQRIHLGNYQKLWKEEIEREREIRKFKLNVRYTNRPRPCTHSSLATFWCRLDFCCWMWCCT